MAPMPSSVNAGGAAVLSAIDGPPPPSGPSVINRDEQGRATIRAVKLSRAFVSMAGSMNRCIRWCRRLLVHSAVARRRCASDGETEAWIMFDERNLYVAGRISDSAPPTEWVANELRRDTAQLRRTTRSRWSWIPSTIGRNAVAFYTNALVRSPTSPSPTRVIPTAMEPGLGRAYGTVSWGMTVEMEIPFRSLRYRRARPGVGGAAAGAMCGARTSGTT